ncbi:MAG TPA: TetR/AcrR family transcriptional regulator [Burkholderiaceae bacterium]|jgi:AcrR family transcriptional regulator|nr:TetR/AcrR family transcriptional regulator [Burkholderiaceae bacterium]
MKPSDLPVLTEHARRLLDAMAQCVSAKGYAATTIADIAAEARVSKRTFYEHFDGKAQCLIALYEAASRQALQVLKSAIDPAQDWHQQAEQALRAYFACMASNPVLMRTLFIEMLALGPEGLAARRRAYRDLAEHILQVVNADVAKAERLPENMAIAIVGGINELVLQAIEEDRVDRLHELTEPAARLVRAVVDHWR